jgi:hypothetical protein
MTRYFKFLTEDYRGQYSRFDFTPYLPRDGQPGEWLPAVEGDLVMCDNGYHVFIADDILYWMNARLYEVELDGEVLAGPYKFLARRMRLLRRVPGWTENVLVRFIQYCKDQVPLHGFSATPGMLWDKAYVFSEEAAEILATVEQYEGRQPFQETWFNRKVHFWRQLGYKMARMVGIVEEEKVEEP